MRATLTSGWSTFAFGVGVPRWYQNSGTAPIYTLATTAGSGATIARIVSAAGTLSTSPNVGVYLDAGETFTMTASVAPNSAAHFWMAVTVLPVSIFTSAQSLLTSALQRDRDAKLAVAKAEQGVTLLGPKLTAITAPKPSKRERKRESKRAIADDEWEPL